jgi:hypothetical protein
MRRRILSLLSLAACVATAHLDAQGVVPPATLRGLQRTSGLNPPGVPGNAVHQVHLVQLPGDPDGTYSCALTVTGLPTTNGGAGGTDIVTGKYDALNDVFTPDLNAAAVNSAGAEFGFMFHHTGLIAVFERTGPTIEVATRPSLTSAWTHAGTVSGITGGPAARDPSLADLAGQLIVIYMLGPAGNASIVYSPLDRNTRVAGPPTTIVMPSGPARQANSPTPIVTSTGELIGLSHHDRDASDNDHWMSMDLDPNTPSVQFIDTPSWKNNGGYAGGKFFDAESAPAPYHVNDVEAVWWTGGRASIGTSMEITANVPPRSSGNVDISFFMLSRGFLSSATPVQGVVGALGVDPTLLILGAIGVHNLRTGRARGTIGVPNDPSLRGLRIPAQSLTVIAGPPGQLVLGNTASITIDP